MVEFDPVLVHEWLSRTAQRVPDRTALVCGGERVSYAALDQATDSFAAALHALGVRRGDRVVILLDNSIATVVAAYGTLKAGGVFAILEGSVKAPKLGYVLENAGARVLVTHVSKEAVVRECVQRMPHLSCVSIWTGAPHAFEQLRTASWNESHEWHALLNKHRQAPRESRPRVIDIDLAALIYTSGSTGEPKGVMSTHHNMVAAARSIIQYVENEPNDIILDVLPLSFDYGLYQVIMAFMFGGTVVLERSFLFLQPILETIVREQVTGFPIVPTVVAMLLKMRDLGGHDLGSLRYVTNTGAALPVEHIRRLRELFPSVRLYSMFGLTECKRVCYLPWHEIDQRPSSVGRAMPNCEVLVLDEQGQPVAPGRPGELVVRGSNVMQGYWRSPETTARAYRPGDYPADRRLYSGDTFRTDHEGYLYFLGRHDDMIKSKGERVSAREIEDVICTLEGVAEAAVVGVPDELLGQAIMAFVVPHPGVAIPPALVQRHCKLNLETFKVPKYVQVVEQLPKTPHGKVDKKVLGIEEGMVS